MEALRPVVLLLPAERPAALLENLRQIAMVTRSERADPFRSAFDSVVGARVDALIQPDVGGTRNMLDAARWGPFAKLRTYALLRLTQL